MYYSQYCLKLKARYFSNNHKFLRVLLNPATNRPPTTNAPNHQPTDPIILFKRLSNRKIFSLQNIHTAENIISVYYLLYLMYNIGLNSIKRLQKKTWLLINTYGGITEVYFVGFKLYCCAPPQLFQSYFLLMEISIRWDVFFHFMRINLINLPKQPSKKTNSNTVWKTEIRHSSLFPSLPFIAKA